MSKLADHRTSSLKCIARYPTYAKLTFFLCSGWSGVGSGAILLGLSASCGNRRGLGGRAVLWCGVARRVYFRKEKGGWLYGTRCSGTGVFVIRKKSLGFGGLPVDLKKKSPGGCSEVASSLLRVNRRQLSDVRSLGGEARAFHLRHAGGWPERQT